MSNIFTSVSDLIGRTPLLELCNIEKTENLKARLLVKLEGCNPGGSAKDRVGLAMIRDAERRGILKPGSVIIEPTSGNTGIGLCSVAAARGYKCIIVMPDSMSMERRLLMGAYGAELVLTDGTRGMAGAIERAEELAAEIPGAFLPDQFKNGANPAAHEATTGPELYEDTDGVSVLEYSLFGRARQRKKNGYKLSRITEMIGSFKTVLFYQSAYEAVKPDMVVTAGCAGGGCGRHGKVV